MNISEPFIRRPVATTLLMIGVVFFCIFTPIAGLLADKYGRRRTLIQTTVGIALFGLTFQLWFAASTGPITVVTFLIVGLSLSWGFNQVAVKLAIHDIPPLIQSTIRSCGAAILVALWARARGIALTTRDGTLAPGIAAGLLFGIEFILIYRGILYTTATRATLFLYTAPFLVAFASRWIFPSDRFTL